MRLAVLSDVHGNLPALEAVLSDVATLGAPDAYWVLGDLVAFCPWPAETLARLRSLPTVSFLQGNTDRYLVTGRRPAAPVRSSDDWAGMPARLAKRAYTLPERYTTSHVVVSKGVRYSATIRTEGILPMASAGS